MNEKLPLYGYKWVDKSIFTSDSIKDYEDESDTGYLLEVDVEYLKDLHSTHKYLPFLTKKRSKLDKKFEHKVTKEINKAHKTYIRPSIFSMNLKTNLLLQFKTK